MVALGREKRDGRTKESKTCARSETQTRENVEEKASCEKEIVEFGKGFLSVENKKRQKETLIFTLFLTSRFFFYLF